MWDWVKINCIHGNDVGLMTMLRIQIMPVNVTAHLWSVVPSRPFIILNSQMGMLLFCPLALLTQALFTFCVRIECTLLTASWLSDLLKCAYVLSGLAVQMFGNLLCLVMVVMVKVGSLLLGGRHEGASACALTICDSARHAWHERLYFFFLCVTGYVVIP